MTQLAIIGSGPRAMTILERLAARINADAEDAAVSAVPAAPATPIEIYLIDAVQVGCGRVWRTDQPDWFLMNTLAGEISAFSGRPDGGPARPGAGPSFAQWWDMDDPSREHANEYASRNRYGRYLLFLLDAIRRSLPPHVTLHEITATVTDLRKDDAGYSLTLHDGRVISVEKAAIVTGHARPRLSAALLELQQFAQSHPGLTFIAGDSSADMPLDEIAPGGKVGILGMGLTFYDVVAALTLGRGGRFTETGTPEGLLRYEPSGNEPYLLAGSRSGFPQPGRGRNQKPGGFSYKPVFFTEELVRAAAGDEELDFDRHLRPRIMAEVDYVYYTALLRGRFGPATAEEFAARIREAGGRAISNLTRHAAEYGLGDEPGLDFDALSQPFAGRIFPDRAAFDRELLAAVDDDVREARRGNVDSPVKAGLDILRSLRWIIRELTDFGGLTPKSHQEGLVDWYSPRSAFLAAGPPLVRLRELRALIDAGILRIIGPQARYTADPATGRFNVSSPLVAGASEAVDTIIDARIPAPDVRADSSEFAQRLLRRGLWSEFVHGGLFETGGVAVTRSPFHPIGADGQPQRGLHVLGIPSEFSRFFTQVVATGPTAWSEVMRDADDVARHLLLPADPALNEDAATETTAPETTAPEPLAIGG